MPENDEISVAVLIERVTQLVNGLQSMERNLSEQSKVTAEIPVMKRDMKEFDEQINRAFSSIKAVNAVSVANSGAIETGRTVMKFVGALASSAFVVALSAVGWSWNQLDALHKTDNDLNIRLTTMEVRSVEADKLQSQGWVRK